MAGMQVTPRAVELALLTAAWVSCTSQPYLSFHSSKSRACKGFSTKCNGQIQGPSHWAVEFHVIEMIVNNSVGKSAKEGISHRVQYGWSIPPLLLADLTWPVNHQKNVQVLFQCYCMKNMVSWYSRLKLSINWITIEVFGVLNLCMAC